MAEYQNFFSQVQVSATPEDRASLHEDLVEILMEVRRCEEWEAHVQPALDRLK